MLDHYLRVTLTVDLAHVVLPHTLTQRDETEHLWLEVGISAKDVQDNAQHRTVITRTENVAIADDKSELPFIVILELRERIDSPA